MLKLAVLRLFFSAFLIVGGLYYIRRGAAFADMFVKSAATAPRWLRPLLPVRWYKSDAGFWLRIGGVLSLLVGVAIFFTVFSFRITRD